MKTQNDKHNHGTHHYAEQIIGFKRFMTYALMIAEQLSDAFWRMFFWTLFFFGIWLMELPELFAMNGWYAASIIFVLGVAYFLFQDLRKLNIPSRRDINKRIERDSALKHRPLSELHDKPINISSPDTMTLWQLEMSRRKQSLRDLRIARWRNFLSGKDVRGLRLMALLVFAAGIMVAGADWNSRLIQGLIPLDWEGKHSALPPVIVTIIPPEYTRIAQNVLQGAGQSKDVIDIPAGSTIKVLMHDTISHPYIVDAGQKRELEAIEDGGYQLEWTAEPSKDQDKEERRRLDVKQFFISRYGFDYNLVPDLPPMISLQDAPEEQKQDAAEPVQDEQLAENEADTKTLDLPVENQVELDAKKTREPIVLPDAQVQIPLKLYDDYGVKTITMTMDLDPVVEEAPLGFSVEQTRSVMSPPGQDFNLAPTFDFTDNTWAGLPVTIDIMATDHLGQTARLETIEMQLPEREFKHPVAKKLIALRKQLAWEPKAAAIEVHDELIEILEYPQDFQDDHTVYLALSIAASRLKYSSIEKDADVRETKSVMDILWSTALKIEDGNLSIAARNLRQAQMALENALENPDITDEQIAELMNELRLAMGDYLSEFEKELQKRFAEGEELLLTPEMLAELMDPDSIADFLAQMETEMREGNMDQAQGMLSQLQRMLDMLNPNMALPMPENMLAMMDGVSELQQLVEKQEELLAQTEEQQELQDKFASDRNFGSMLEPNMELFLQWGLDDVPPPPSADTMKDSRAGIDFEQHKAEQEGLRYVLGQLMLETSEALGKIPDEMGLAEREMLYSSNDLGEEQPDESIPHQELAIEYLRRAQEAMQQELQEQMEQMAGAMNQEGDPFGQRFGQQFGQRGQGGMRYDPLGRPLQGGEGGEGLLPNSDVKIPDEAEKKRVEEILRTLRERSGELFRPREELDYFRRLLRQF